MKIRIAHRLRSDPDSEITERSVETEDYDAGLAELRAALPEGHILLWIDVDH
ncbi:hypothetical protein GUY44_29010 [Pimelobacter simplex]|uniref:hypothetical protein n=1 Tax=Nocardioides simplex TaxID=2045 RepID=UPI0005D965CA|nr:hypothetical protein [Pimelobacter simplex]MCG8154544.1 hypothetical protein [Pimelobacter simplex]GEB12590.1 hypothetical protein NSI01_09050 [Pimelobacter simplex]SFM92928.1 hypothetical protein SAMN05421671_4138 [Pimelobacter simplex]